jgi:hypothetical protein
MIQLCCITVITKSSRHERSQMFCAQDSLCNILWIFEHSKDVIAFKVSLGTDLVTNKTFGWGEFAKWVNEFTQEHYMQT